MAGGGAAAGGFGGAGSGGGDQRRNYGGQSHSVRGGGRPPRPYGRGRGRDQQGGRDRDQGGRGDRHMGRGHRGGNAGGAHGSGTGGSHGGADKGLADEYNIGKEKDLVKSELPWAIPIKLDLVVREHGNNTYIVPFPCQVELQKMISMKCLRTDNNEGVMLFEEWNNEIKLKQVAEDDAHIVVDDCLYEIFFKVDQVVLDNTGGQDEFDEDNDFDPDNHNVTPRI
ncbi:hypothetical protein BAE44_0020202 [Dichanthelium oligosanthes]|uniref:DUF4283 domain-containing protein n=1 Tax=Dichanthelium oligosanthes TaxID=888268 RepID=A0A1E5V0W7_9POAL|nr:hypothetical protein BAE44_0020202 [Dichanthelium oligosanthes]